MIASTVPELMRAPNSSSQSPTASQRETQLRTDSLATAASSRGPKELLTTLVWQLCARAPAAGRTAQPLGVVLGHPHHDRRQLFDLVACRPTDWLTLID